MASVNKAILVGNLGRTPEIRYTPQGAAVCTISIATTSRWRDKATGNQQEVTEWHRVVLHGRLAELAGEYLRKGSPVYIEGRMATRKWTGKDGTDRTITEVIADSMQFLGSNPQRNTEPADSSHSTPTPSPKPSNKDDDSPF